MFVMNDYRQGYVCDGMFRLDFEIIGKTFVDSIYITCYRFLQTRLCPIDEKILNMSSLV